MKLHVIHAGTFKLDGGAMFGVVPKVLWNRHQPADDNNRCTWAMRCLLIEAHGKRILIDTGMGTKQDAKFRSHFEPGGPELIDSLADKGYAPADITDVVLTHLHFDHCGGAVKRDDEGGLTPTFPNATYWSERAHWAWATDPNDREKASFLGENILPLLEHEVLEFVNEDTEIIPELSFMLAHGHTDSMLIPKLETDDGTLVFMADLLPSPTHIPLPWVMGYDIRPMQTLREKEVFLEEALDGGYVLFFEHDPAVECCVLTETKKGIRAGHTFPLTEWTDHAGQGVQTTG